ncbi:hypothetical protein SAICODRAFT_32398 [Saitoella complicata NRRL Y-17804]|uniref:uncharacterized protein n=1 Tax=Saitoella complicata (strain BCRC 22490 / CBS 7301 / JCM 7358 / NBRC 10748 / NRRL Y-17804) TaxID=698492 RepID=UPI000867139C|nr:uncharacterized protein SAICODRAFT_32398 [Saitoella complicata NRRL Y-17804]ODQ49631.1 hypothetical protein SAICODRAFT_32398 [Saitoella complicata NRRL Y-17804]
MRYLSSFPRLFLQSSNHIPYHSDTPPRPSPTRRATLEPAASISPPTHFHLRPFPGAGARPQTTGSLSSNMLKRPFSYTLSSHGEDHLLPSQKLARRSHPQNHTWRSSTLATEDVKTPEIEQAEFLPTEVRLQTPLGFGTPRNAGAPIEFEGSPTLNYSQQSQGSLIDDSSDEEGVEEEEMNEEEEMEDDEDAYTNGPLTQQSTTDLDVDEPYIPESPTRAPRNFSLPSHAVDDSGFFSDQDEDISAGSDDEHEGDNLEDQVLGSAKDLFRMVERMARELKKVRKERDAALVRVEVLEQRLGM